MIVDERKYAVNSIHRASLILECLIDNKNTITEIADYCELKPSTTHRLLKALEESGLVLKNPLNHKYFLGPLVTRLASNQEIIHEHLITCAIEEMNYLSNYTEETITLGVLIGLSHMRLHEIPCKHALKVTVPDKMMGPLFFGSPGKVLISFLEDRELEKIIYNTNSDTVTSSKISDKQKFLENIKGIRQQGYAISHDEVYAGAMSISVPIKNYGLPAVLSVLGPPHRLEGIQNEIIQELKKCSVRISKKLIINAGI